MKPPILPTFHVATLCITHATDTRESGCSGCRILKSVRQSLLFASKLHVVRWFSRTSSPEYQLLLPSCWLYGSSALDASAFFSTYWATRRLSKQNTTERWIFKELGMVLPIHWVLCLISTIPPVTCACQKLRISPARFRDRSVRLRDMIRELKGEPYFERGRKRHSEWYTKR